MLFRTLNQNFWSRCNKNISNLGQNWTKNVIVQPAIHSMSDTDKLNDMSLFVVSNTLAFSLFIIEFLLKRHAVLWYPLQNHMQQQNQTHLAWPLTSDLKKSHLKSIKCTWSVCSCALVPFHMCALCIHICVWGMLHSSICILYSYGMHSHSHVKYFHGHLCEFETDAIYYTTQCIFKLNQVKSSFQVFHIQFSYEEYSIISVNSNMKSKLILIKNFLKSNVMTN